VTSPESRLLSGAEYVLVARIPKAGSRWRQAHLNRDIVEQFFRLKLGERRTITLERVDYDGYYAGQSKATLVYSEVNKNPKIELDFSPIRGYPAEGPPLVVVVELDRRTFRYRPLIPGGVGYEAMLQLNTDAPPVGRGVRRTITTLDEIELRWPQARLRDPKVRNPLQP